ncbi:hypothetical protein LC147_11950 [Vibrio harveyi]|uniref:hypothetical protein n=1 Tax=Vibrio harveyi TaxID=669 RepID=UPI003BB6B124
MAKINWELIKKQYLSEHLETGVDVKTFCVRNGLNYSTARKYLNNKLLESEKNTETEQKENTTTERAQKPKLKHKPSKTDADDEPKTKKQSNRGGKRPGAGAPAGNKNAFVHGLMTRAFGSLVKYSHQVDDDFKLEVHKLAALQALECHARYKQELEEYMQELAEREDPKKPLTEQQQDDLFSLEKRISSSLNQVCYHTSKLEAIESSMANRNYTNRSTSKVIAQTAQVEVDTKLKRKGIGLAEANTEKARAQTELAKHELDIKTREGLGDDDDLGMDLAEIQDLDDDEILARFKAKGGELIDDDE